MIADLRQAVRGPVLVVGVGNTARGDDGVGPAVVEELRRLTGGHGRGARARRECDGAQPPSAVSLPPGEVGFAVLDAGDAPERYLGPMAESGADVVLFVDAVDFGGKAGQALLLEETDLPARSCVTHRSSLGLVMRYLREQAGQRCLVIGVQPGAIAPASGMTPPVRTAVKGIAAAISEAIAGQRRGRSPDRPAGGPGGSPAPTTDGNGCAGRWGPRALR